MNKHSAEVTEKARQILEWFFCTDAGLLARVGTGATIFTALALIDIYRNGNRATRWREYLFLLAVVVMAMMYGVANDLITSQISWEYFLYGKGLSETLGSSLPPDFAAMAWEVSKIGMKATWSVGLIIGVALLIANNPSVRCRQLAYRALLWRGILVIFCSLFFAVIVGIAGYRGWLVHATSDFAEMIRNNEFRPYRFMAVYGIHLGGYVGGAIGTIAAVVSIRARRIPFRSPDGGYRIRGD